MNITIFILTNKTFQDEEDIEERREDDEAASELELEVLLIPGTPRDSSSDTHSFSIDDDSLQPSPSISEQSSSDSHQDDHHTVTNGHHRSVTAASKTYVVDLEIGNDLDKLRLSGSSSASTDQDSGSDSTTSEESGYHEKSSLEDEQYEIEFSTSQTIDEADETPQLQTSRRNISSTNGNVSSTNVDELNIVNHDQLPEVRMERTGSLVLDVNDEDKPTVNVLKDNTVEIVVSF